MNLQESESQESQESMESMESIDSQQDTISDKTEELILVSELSKSFPSQSSTLVCVESVNSIQSNEFIYNEINEIHDEKQGKEPQENDKVIQESIQKDPSLLLESMTQLQLNSPKETSQETSINSISSQNVIQENVNPIGQVYYPSLPNVGPYYDYYRTSPIEFMNSSSPINPMNSGNPINTNGMNPPSDPLPSQNTKTVYADSNPPRAVAPHLYYPSQPSQSQQSSINTSFRNTSRDEENLSFSSNVKNEKNSLEQYREMAKSSSDPKVQLEFVKFVV